MKFILIFGIFLHFIFLISCSFSQFSLPNHLSVLLKHNPISQRNGIGLLMEAGSSHEPRNVQGLAHLLEHMLFMASNKYPKEGYFKEILAKSNGHSNAMTTDTLTVYFFDIDSHSANFELITDVFSRFFIDPIIQEETLSREINAVNNEYENDLNSNEWRFQELMRTLADPKSAFNHFSIGNRDTLKITSENGKLKDIIQEFYNKFYVSSKMHLFVNSNLPMKKMKQMISKIFGKIPNKPPFKLPKHLIERKAAFPNSILGSLAWYKPIGNLKMMSVIFPFEDLQLLQIGKENHYFSYIEQIIKDRSENSIYTRLKKEELILSLEIGRFDRYYKLRIMSVRFLLTTKGVGNAEKILQIFFDGLKKLKTQAIRKSFFKKIGIRNFVSFLFREKIPFFEETIQTLLEMKDGQKFEENEILRREIFVNFDEKVISKIFDRLIPEKSIVIFASEDFSRKTGRFKTFHRIKNWIPKEPIIINDFKFEQKFLDSSVKRLKVEAEVENDRRILRFYVKGGVIKNSIMSEKNLDKFEDIMKINYAFEKMPLSLLKRIKTHTNLIFTFNPNNNYFPSNFQLASSCQKIQLDSKQKKNGTFFIIQDPISIYEGLIKNRSEKLYNFGSFGIPKKCLNKERYLSFANNPNKVIFSPTLKMWIQPNLLIISPKAFLSLSIKSNLIHVNQKIAYLERMMFISVFEERWGQQLSLIHEGGFQISITNTKDGVILRISGFSDKIEAAGVDLLDFFKKTHCSEKKFELIKASMKRQFADYDKTPKHKLLWQYFDKILDYENYILNDEMNDLVNKLNYTHYKKFENSLVHDFSIEVFLYGNVDSSQSKEIVRKFKKIVESHKIMESKSNSVEKKVSKITKLPFLKRNLEELVLYQKSTNINDRNNAILNIYLCKLKKNYKEALNFIHPRINIAAFLFLRTKRQLGYIVQSKYINTDDTIGISILVQGSKKTAAEMDQDIEDFIKYFSRNLENQIKNLPNEEKNSTNSTRKSIAQKEKFIARNFFSSDIKVNGEKAWKQLHQKIAQYNEIIKKKSGKKEQSKPSKKQVKESVLTKKNVIDLIEDLFGKNRKKISIQFESIFSKSYSMWQSKTKRLKKNKKKAFISSIRQLGKYLQEKK